MNLKISLNIGLDDDKPMYIIRLVRAMQETILDSIKLSKYQYLVWIVSDKLLNHEHVDAVPFDEYYANLYVAICESTRTLPNVFIHDGSYKNIDVVMQEGHRILVHESTYISYINNELIPNIGGEQTYKEALESLIENWKDSLGLGNE